jgi:hypothetical protein
MGGVRTFTGTTSATVEDGHGSSDFCTYCMGFLTLTLTHISCLRHKPLSFEEYVYASCIILNVICNISFCMYICFTGRATHVLSSPMSPVHDIGSQDNL